MMYEDRDTETEIARALYRVGGCKSDHLFDSNGIPLVVTEFMHLKSIQFIQCDPC